MMLYSAEIEEINPTLSPYTSTYLIEIVVIADSAEEAIKKVETRIEEIKSKRMKDKKRDDEREQREKEKNPNKIVYGLYSRSEYRIKKIEEFSNGIMEVYYAGTG